MVQSKLLINKSPLNTLDSHGEYKYSDKYTSCIYVEIKCCFTRTNEVGFRCFYSHTI